MRCLNVVPAGPWPLRAARVLLACARFTPVRLSYAERKYLRILEGSFQVSEYTTKVPARGASRRK